ncbi:LOW QUALITY PROTEIN: hypothetical protein T265_13999 [Opisthorchis viverrini]|uniref:Uncharacterized protein n=1 Tax=Opisthorchis viverrini TaxID=6198 RepID=A0A074ZGS5_OPIVI|nr:LOW QUALITY PROTEIN: hypothetical protein T265_13999 [Opisthorchis viverrini]KER26413.1 LOW QUALITY PROTEIN: hypothetical protein T265_13999 [Opisthorchis viverrini]
MSVSLENSPIWVQVEHKVDGNSGTVPYLISPKKGETGCGLLKSFQQPFSFMKTCKSPSTLENALRTYIDRDVLNIVTTETSDGLVQHIQLKHHVTNKRFSWVPVSNIITIDSMTSSVFNTDASLPYNHDLIESLVVKKRIKCLQPGTIRIARSPSWKASSTDSTQAFRDLLHTPLPGHGLATSLFMLI